MSSVYPYKEYYRFLLSSLVLVICSYATILVDAAVGGYFLGSEAVSAINLVLPFNEIFYSVALLFGLGATIVASAAFGQKDLLAVRRHFTVAVSSLSICLIGLAVVLYLSRSILVDWLTAGSSLRPMTSAYLIAMIPWFVVNGLLLIFKEFTMLSGHPQLVMYSALVQFVVNIGCDILFLGVLHLGIWALALSSCIAASVLFVLLWMNYLRRDCPFHLVLCSRSDYLATLRLNLRYGSGFICCELSYIVFALVMNTLVLRLMGEQALFIWSVITLVFYTANYVAVAGQETCITLGGRYHGLGDDEIVQRINHRTYAYVAGGILLLLVATLLFPHTMMPLYGASDPTQYSMLLPVIALAIPFICGSNGVGLASLRLLQQGHIVRYSWIQAISYLHIPCLFLLFHYLLPGYEWWSFLGMIPVQILLMYLIRS